MSNYKKMYLVLINSVTAVIEVLHQAQQRVDKSYVQDLLPTLAKVEPGQAEIGVTVVFTKVHRSKRPAPPTITSCAWWMTPMSKT